MSILEKIKHLQSNNLNFDHDGHQVLYNAAYDIRNTPGIACEIGIREGGGMGIVMQACIDAASTDRIFLGIDPYGNIPYTWKEGLVVQLDYTNSMKNKALSALYAFADLHSLYFDFYSLTDIEFFKRFADGIPYYNETSSYMDSYAIVHLDGPHAVKELREELEFFKPRVVVGGYIVLDDTTSYYDLAPLQSFLVDDGTFELVLNDNKKASYKRVK